MKIVLLGSGNVATHLGKALHLSGNQIIQVWSRNQLHAQELAEQIDAEPLSGTDQINSFADLYIVSVTDNSITDTIALIPGEHQLIAHTAGSVDMKILSARSNNIGVIYPVQTFTKQKEIDFRQIPIAIEGSDFEVTEKLIALAESISDQVFQLNSASRMALHISAVLACNFSNHLYALAESLLQQQGVDFSIIYPLIAETAEKALKISPRQAQTGPAVRGDSTTIDKHIEFLKTNPELQELYVKLSQSIMRLNLGLQ